ncbi:sensor histidine kinase [Sporomusa sphaeroides DSM 2875]|uniref:sensor histidine kinase n=1 Tax=Sporomusa sphaeroides TaxID=47679 RepID=UPI00202E7A96|nr:sensor histidine kinase [Sporomusa sphaeroides]MCM0760770.1 sensor histidine kinase [Sporomusa sphaeroides DSM 2875]
MGKAVTFKDYMKRVFVRYIVALICLMFIVFLAFMLLNYRLFVVKANTDCNQTVSAFVAGQWTVYQQGIKAFAENAELKNAFSAQADLREVNQQLYEFSLSQQLKANFVLLNQDHEIISTNLYKTNQLLFLTNRTVQEALTRLAGAPDMTYSGVIHIPFDHGQKSDLTFIRAVQDGGRPVGYLVFSLQEDSLGVVMRNREADIIVITDAFNNVIFSTNNLLIDSLGKYKDDPGDASSLVLDEKPYHVTTNTLADSNMRIITLLSVAQQQQIVQFGGFFLLGISCFLLLLIRFLADKITARHLSSIDELLYAVNECRQGNIDYRIKSQSFSEFQMLYDNFNSMMLKVQQLLQSNNEMAERKRLMEVKHLEGQFNPHFAFNVMEALRYEILINPEQAARLVVAFANLMRYSINYGSTHVSLQTDIGYVQDYLLLQKMRYNQRLEYVIDIEETILPYKVPKLLIQPIVENSIIHGLENSKKITIRITGRRQAKQLVLCVEDDGPGLDAARLAALQAVLNDENAMPKRIGLYNVHRVAQLLYGQEYGLTIESVDGEGMRVLLKVPVILEDDDV